MKSIFWEFEISIWLNAVCRAVSLFVLGIAMCRIGDVVNKTHGLNVNGTLMCLNWTLLVFTATVQISLVIFYSLGLVYEETSVFQHYTTVMMYVNVACTCVSQILLSYIFTQFSTDITIKETEKKGKVEVKVLREK